MPFEDRWMKPEPQNGGGTQRGLGAWELKMLSTQQYRGKCGIQLSIDPSVYLSVHLYIYLSIYLSNLSIYLSSVVGWHHQFNGHELGQIQEMVREQEGLACFSPWGRKSQTWLGDLNNIYLSICLPTYLSTSIYLEIKRKGMEFVPVATLSKKKKVWKERERKDKEKEKKKKEWKEKESEKTSENAKQMSSTTKATISSNIWL